MADPRTERDTVERREASARHALDAYRERRRRRRAEDTYFGSAEALLDDAEASQTELDRRRSSLLHDAEGEGMPLDLAELLYDVAQEEGIDPVLAYELVLTGLGVSPPPGGTSNATTAPAVDKYLPTWMFPAEPTDRVLRERMLRLSFRRLRGFLQETQDVDEAFRLFAREPDVGHFGY